MSARLAVARLSAPLEHAGVLKAIRLRPAAPSSSPQADPRSAPSSVNGFFTGELR